MKKVYIASPYRGLVPEEAVETQIIAANQLIDLGFNPYVPLLSYYLDIRVRRTAEEWLKILCMWIKDCDILLRLPGKSEGADKEERIARGLGIPVYYSVEELVVEFTKR